MAGKIGKFLAFIALAGAACAGVCYLFTNGDRKKQSIDNDKETNEFFEKAPTREYVSLNNESTEQAETGTKKAIAQKLGEVANELKEKAQEVADGVGLYKSSAKDTSDFEFEEFDEEKEETKEEDKTEESAIVSDEAAQISAQ